MGAKQPAKILALEKSGRHRATAGYEKGRGRDVWGRSASHAEAEEESEDEEKGAYFEGESPGMEYSVCEVCEPEEADPPTPTATETGSGEGVVGPEAVEFPRVKEARTIQD